LKVKQKYNKLCQPFSSEDLLSKFLGNNICQCVCTGREEDEEVLHYLTRIEVTESEDKKTRLQNRFLL
jgi:hypothetical protein